MRKKFDILYPEDHEEESLRGTRFKPGKDSMVVMSSSGVFFLFKNEPYYPYIRLLSDILPKYDVEWK